MKKDILISVIIPIKNGDYWLEETLKSIQEQSLFHCTEIIAIDSGSTDKSLEILSKHEVRIIHVEPTSFNHGLTRNIGVNAAHGKFVVMTVQDAQPTDNNWLQHLLDGFEKNDKTAGVCGQQIVPHDRDKNPVEWFRPQSLPSIKEYSFSSQKEFEDLSPVDKRRVCGWDNVTAMYRKDILLKIPFQEVTFAEDCLWARDVLCRGYSVVYNTAARVNHYHLSIPDFVLKRQFTVFYHFYMYFGLIPSYSKKVELRKFLSNLKTLLLNRELTWKEKVKWIQYNYVLRKNIIKAISLFQKNLRLGQENLRQKHMELCGLTPLAIRPDSL